MSKNPSSSTSARPNACGGNEAADPWARLALITALVAFGAAMRLVPHEWNVAPVGAIALFAGAHFRNPFWAIFTPLAALLSSDTIIELTGIHNRPGFYPDMPFTYAGFVAVALIGMLLQGQRGSAARRVLGITGATLSGSLVFYLVSNFGPWLQIYPQTWQGFVQCYVNALPFLGRTLLGDAIYVSVLFGTFALAEHFIPAWTPARQAQPST
jgi:hypothetical protein